MIAQNATTTTTTTTTKTHQIWLGAQNTHHVDSGPYTGEVSPLILAQLGCRLIEIGHAERRAPPLCESDDLIAAKAQAVVRNGMIPLVCIGESTSPRPQLVSESVGFAVAECARQVRAVLGAVPRHAPVVFAYEPVWAIGAAEPAGADHVNAVVAGLRGVEAVRVREGHVRWLYGGSAGPGVWDRLRGSLDGLFLGRFAHEVPKMVETVQEVGEMG
ncbi:MAG: hypothetical protein Q9163_006184 [Psora crenata]